MKHILTIHSLSETKCVVVCMNMMDDDEVGEFWGGELEAHLWISYLTNFIRELSVDFIVKKKLFHELHIIQFQELFFDAIKTSLSINIYIRHSRPNRKQIHIKNINFRNICIPTKNNSIHILLIKLIKLSP